MRFGHRSLAYLLPIQIERLMHLQSSLTTSFKPVFSVRGAAMLITRSLLPAIALALCSSMVDAQVRFHRVAEFGDPNDRARRFKGGREVEFTADGEVMLVVA